MDYLVLLQAILYFCICICGFMVSVPVAVNRSNFGGVCILYADVNWGQIEQTNQSICDFAIYFGAFGLIIFGLLVGALFLYFAIMSRKDKDVGKGIWTIPFLPINIAAAFVTLVAACVLTVGFNMFCSSMKKRYACDWKGIWTIPFLPINIAAAFVTLVAACVLTVGFNMFCSSMKKRYACDWKGIWTIPFLPINIAAAFVTLVAACVLTVGFNMFCSSMKKRYACDWKGIWTIPFLPINIAAAFVTLVAACVLTVGFNMFCSSMKKRYACDCCEDSEEWTFDGSKPGPYFDLSSVSQAAAWIGFLLYLTQTGISVLRFYRNRQSRK